MSDPDTPDDPGTPQPRTFSRKRAGLRRVMTRSAAVLRAGARFCVWAAAVAGAAWTLSPVWGVFTDRLAVSVAWVVPFLQSTWPAGFALVTVAVIALLWLRLWLLPGSRSRGRRSRLVASGATVCALLLCTATVLVPGILGRVAERAPGEKDASTVRVLSVNTWYHQASDSALAATARDYDADIVVLPESSDTQASAVAEATGLELVQPVSTRTRGGGTALLVRPSWLVEESVEDLHLTRHQNPVAELGDTAADTAAPSPFTMAAVHTNAPAYSHLVGGWITEMRDLRDWAAGVQGPLVMAGDFNATAAHPELRRLSGGASSSTGLEDCGGGLFAAPTWPRAGVPSPVPLLRLDHILVRGMSCASSGVVGVPGSDHAGIWADLQV